MKTILMCAFLFATACGVETPPSTAPVYLCIEGDTSCGPAGYNPSKTPTAQNTQTYAASYVSTVPTLEEIENGCSVQVDSSGSYVICSVYVLDTHWAYCYIKYDTVGNITDENCGIS